MLTSRFLSWPGQMLAKAHTESLDGRTRIAEAAQLRRWFMPLVTAGLILANLYSDGLDGPTATAIAAALIMLCGVPHGTLDVEIAALRFGRQGLAGKLKITAAYAACAAAMAVLWAVLPALALVAFIVLSIIHFGADWRTGVDPFFAMMVGWALIASPALAHPAQVAAIFETLTGDGHGGTIAALLACTAIPALIGSLLFGAQAFRRAQGLSGLDVICCLVAALVLPPLAGFAVFFCGLHSPRHLAEALRQSGPASNSRKAIIGGAVLALSFGIAAVIFFADRTASVDASIIRTAFVLLSILTVPHFILEQMLGKVAQSDAG